MQHCPKAPAWRARFGFLAFFSPWMCRSRASWVPAGVSGRFLLPQQAFNLNFPLLFYPSVFRGHVLSGRQGLGQFSPPAPVAVPRGWR